MTSLPQAAFLQVTDHQAHRLQVRTPVPEEDATRYLGDVSGLILRRDGVAFSSFNDLLPGTVIELHLLYEGSGDTLPIPGKVTSRVGSSVPHEGKMATQYRYDVMFKRGVTPVVDYVWGVLEGRLSGEAPPDFSLRDEGVQGWWWRLWYGLLRRLQTESGAQVVAVALLLAIIWLVDAVAGALRVGWPVVALALFFFGFLVLGVAFLIKMIPR